MCATPCCDYHAAQAVCTTCGQFIDADETRYYGWRHRAKQTFWSPAEYECGGPFCVTCWDAQQHEVQRVCAGREGQ